jgi:hypothetical protein
LLDELTPHRLGEVLQLGIENRLGAVVGNRELELVVEHQHAGRQIGENALQPRFRRFQRDAVGLDHMARLVELVDHRIEALSQHAELVARRYRHLAREIAARHRLHCLRQARERLGE